MADLDLKEYIDTLGLEFVSNVDFGNKRGWTQTSIIFSKHSLVLIWPGLTPKLTEIQIKAWDTLASKLNVNTAKLTKSKSYTIEDGDEEDEDEVDCDVLSTKHCILHDSKVLKRSKYFWVVISFLLHLCLCSVYLSLTIYIRLSLFLSLSLSIYLPF